MGAEERWVGVEDVAAHLGVAKDSVYRWIEERGLPAHRVGRLFRFKLSEIDAWVRRDGDQGKMPNSVRGRPSSKPQTNQLKTKTHARKSDGNG